jgi:aromatic ring-opening dioxygenase catalytic subunit (LigB family)
MAEIVGAFGLPHNPHFPAWSADGHPLGPEIDSYYGEVAERLAAVAPDALIFITSDHYNMFFETLPLFAIGVAEAAAGPSDYPEIARRELPIDAALARYLDQYLVEAEFDVAQLQELEFDHTVIAPLGFVWPGEPVPVVPLFISAFLRPIASAHRVYALGRTIRQALVARTEGPQRIAVIASGSFSVEIGGPRLFPDAHVGVPAPQWTERVVELLGAGDFDTLVAESTDEQLREAGNAGGEILDWIAMLGMIDAAPPETLRTQAQFGHSYATWPIDRVAGAEAAR